MSGDGGSMSLSLSELVSRLSDGAEEDLDACKTS